MTRQIFLDTETTGLSPEAGDRIIELGCVEMVNRRLTGRNLHFYLNLMARVRLHLELGTFDAFRKRFVANYIPWKPEEGE